MAKISKADIIRNNFDKLDDTEIYTLLLLIGETCVRLEELIPEDGYITEDNISYVETFMSLNGIKKTLLHDMKRDMDNIIYGAKFGDYPSDELYEWLEEEVDVFGEEE